MATAIMEVTVDFPTPPLPETTAMTCLILDSLLAGASRLSGLRLEQLSPQLSQLPLHDALIVKTPFLFYSNPIRGKCQMIHFWKVSARITLALAATDGKTNYIAAFIKANTSRKR